MSFALTACGSGGPDVSSVGIEAPQTVVAGEVFQVRAQDGWLLRVRTVRVQTPTSELELLLHGAPAGEEPSVSSGGAIEDVLDAHTNNLDFKFPVDAEIGTYDFCITVSPNEMDSVVTQKACSQITVNAGQ